MIGTFEKWKPLMVGQDHKTWKSKQGKIMFDFIGVISGQEGKFSSTKNEPIFKIGEQVSYDVTVKEGNKYANMLTRYLFEPILKWFQQHSPFKK